MLDTLDAAAVRRWCASGLAALKRHQGEIDALNVYPVPDGDTGTNLVLTLTSAQQALAMDLDTLADGAATAHGHALRLMARGALLGARGNSGVILSQILRGFADALAGVPAVRGRELAVALRDATTAAYAAVARPMEGTLLSVVSAAAGAAERTGSDELRAVARAAAGAAATALARTPEQLPALARAGVVDAGGRGLCLLLDALVEVITGESPQHPAPPLRAVPPPVTAVRETGSLEYAYEVQFLLDAEPEAVGRMRDTLATLGDCLVVVGDSGTWQVHVHVNDVGAAIEAGVVAGRPHQISVTRFADQLASVPAPDGRAAVVVAAGAGLAELFAGEGAVAVPGNPSTGELLEAVLSTGAARVVVLPNDPDAQAVANQVAEEAHRFGVQVSVVPTRSPVQALAALAVRDPRRRFADDVIAMAEAAGACRYAEVCHAGREALTVAGPCRAGDVLALVEGEVHLIGVDLVDTCVALVDRMLGGGGELVTLLVGADAPEGLAEAVRTHLARRWPFVEVQAYQGGQPRYPLLVGVE
ncbi:DAK2 domain-containing protein [Micromonospora endophytica]|uniref:Dak phosphatase n=1 Tax=Micromonospora endophytica TaxID=515350 RepID=A0A2W2DX08_9ACTN|nr:DAK2 domain-containing protein [Micromonospora endophytica]PZF97403.1 Dak phosphatase [Micromonospora endophytica]RIW45023.1 DAK2 domain-containing protein [Micromonospora endophytica]BCJ57983.1 dihydroxyacetone kinase [Micromonospora endophytica]